MGKEVTLPNLLPTIGSPKQPVGGSLGLASGEEVDVVDVEDDDDESWRDAAAAGGGTLLPVPPPRAAKYAAPPAGGSVSQPAAAAGAGRSPRATDLVGGGGSMRGVDSYLMTSPLIGRGPRAWPGRCGLSLRSCIYTGTHQLFPTRVLAQLSRL